MATSSSAALLNLYADPEHEIWSHSHPLNFAPSAERAYISLLKVPISQPLDAIKPTMKNKRVLIILGAKIKPPTTTAATSATPTQPATHAATHTLETTHTHTTTHTTEAPETGGKSGCGGGEDGAVGEEASKSPRILFGELPTWKRWDLVPDFVLRSCSVGNDGKMREDLSAIWEIELRAFVNPGSEQSSSEQSNSEQSNSEQSNSSSPSMEASLDRSLIICYTAENIKLLWLKSPHFPLARILFDLVIVEEPSIPAQKEMRDSIWFQELKTRRVVYVKSAKPSSRSLCSPSTVNACSMHRQHDDAPPPPARWKILTADGNTHASKKYAENADDKSDENAGDTGVKGETDDHGAKVDGDRDDGDEIRNHFPFSDFCREYFGEFASEDGHTFSCKNPAKKNFNKLAYREAGLDAEMIRAFEGVPTPLCLQVATECKKSTEKIERNDTAAAITQLRQILKPRLQRFRPNGDQDPHTPEDDTHTPGDDTHTAEDSLGAPTHGGGSGQRLVCVGCSFANPTVLIINCGHWLHDECFESLAICESPQRHEPGALIVKCPKCVALDDNLKWSRVLDLRLVQRLLLRSVVHVCIHAFPCCVPTLFITDLFDEGFCSQSDEKGDPNHPRLTCWYQPDVPMAQHPVEDVVVFYVRDKTLGVYNVLVEKFCPITPPKTITLVWLQ